MVSWHATKELKMLILYNILHLIGVLLLFPLLCIYCAAKAKYRRHLPKRLGLGLNVPPSWTGHAKKTLWIHALSVGEVTSALPLLIGLRQRLGDVSIVFSASTSTGVRLAQKLASPHCDRVVAFPVDLLPVCSYFLRRIRPDLFILVETDFWPNFLEQLHRRNIPAVLVNGRISQSSQNLYRRYSFFFKPMFSTFALVCAQSEADRGKFLDLGVERGRVFTLGNLKYEAVTSSAHDTAKRLTGATSGFVFIAGSTHADEELLLFRVFTQLKKRYAIRMVIAPRDISRCRQLQDLAQSRGLTVQLRSADRPFSEDIYLVDSLGELAAFYACGDICFVGGSLVACGGHNPLEPASLNKPVLFGPDMSDFEEISAALLACQGAYQVSTVDDFISVADELISNPHLRNRCGEAAGNCVRLHQGIVDKHIDLIEDLI